ncbi:MAG TPA: FAD-dependent oxidoreductase [Acidimicrobiia bacterium]|nr:FAD-dependent oxidoreductase [Acidimicrobiia bacterium]
MNPSVAVIGGGIAGVSAAYELARAGCSVTVLEGEPVLASHATGRSAALYFENYGALPNRALTRASRPFFDSPPEGLVDHPLLAERGAMWIGTPDQENTLRAHLAESAAGSHPGRWLSPSKARALVPVLRIDYLGGAVYEPESLDLDVAGLHQAFVRGLRRAGGEVRVSSPVTRLARSGSQWTVATGSDEIRVDVVVNAAGAWGDEIAALAEARPVGLVPMRRTAFTAPGENAYRYWPLVADADNQFYFRPDGSQLLCSLAEERPSPPEDARPDELDIALAIERINSATMLGIRVVRSSWTGLRTFVADRAMVIGFDPEIEGFFWLVGQGGTGIQTAPAAALLTAALITSGAPVPALVEYGIDLAGLSPGRLVADRSPATAPLAPGEGHGQSVP